MTKPSTLIAQHKIYSTVVIKASLSQMSSGEELTAFERKMRDHQWLSFPSAL